MWKTAIKFLALISLRKSLNFVNKDFHHVKSNMADLAESRASFFKNNFNSEVKRIVRSLVGLMLAFTAIACASISGILWAAATAWSSPHRDLILGTTTLVFVLIGAIIFVAIHYSWNSQPLFYQSIKLIEQDWYLLRNTNKPND